MNLDEIFKKAAQKMNGACRCCSICDGKVCAGEVPGMGGIGTGNSFKANIEALNNVKLKLRTIHSAVSPQLNLDFLKESLSLPVIAAPIAGMGMNAGGAITEERYNEIVVNASQDFGTIAMTGDGPNNKIFKAGINSIENKNKVIPVIKPRPKDEITKKISEAYEAGAVAVGIDIDSAGLINMIRNGHPVGPKTEEELSQIIEESPLPVIIKGIMTVEDALCAYRAGAAALVVSNHGGRVLDNTPGTAEVLPDIALHLKGKIHLMADGGVRSGIDVIKMLALGADIVLVGRPILCAAIGGEEKGVETLYKNYYDNMLSSMLLTGCSTVDDINQEIIY